MWPGRATPTWAASSSRSSACSRQHGHEVEVVSIDHRGRSRAKYAAALPATPSPGPAASRPDVIFAHMLFPAGAAGAMASIAGARAARRHGSRPGRRQPRPRSAGHAATRWVVGRSAGLICNSRWLADRLVAAIPAAAPKSRSPTAASTSTPSRPRTQPRPGRELGWDGDGPAFVCVGSLIERKNVVRLADAFARLGRGRLAFVGDGPLRASSRAATASPSPAAIPQGEVPRWIAAADVALPAVADRALRPGDAGGAGDGAQRRRDDRRRPAGVRAAGGRGPGRPRGRPRP